MTMAMAMAMAMATGTVTFLITSVPEWMVPSPEHGTAVAVAVAEVITSVTSVTPVASAVSAAATGARRCSATTPGLTRKDPTGTGTAAASQLHR